MFFLIIEILLLQTADGKNEVKKYDDWKDAVNFNKKHSIKYGLVMDKLIIINNHFYAKGAQNGTVICKTLLSDNKQKFLESESHLKIIKPINSPTHSPPKSATTTTKKIRRKIQMQIPFELESNTTKTPLRSKLQIQLTTPLTKKKCKRYKKEMSDTTSEENETDKVLICEFFFIGALICKGFFMGALICNVFF